MDLLNARVLVTGGAGFIGSRLTHDLLSHGADVYVVDNFFTGRQSLIPEGASSDEIDILSEQFADGVLGYKPDVIVHLAALHYLPYCNEHRGETFDVNVMGTRAVLSAAERVEGLESVVYTSSGAVYPPRGEPNHESTKTGPIDIYGKTKLVGEDLLRDFAHRTDITSVTARLFNVYGPNETNSHLIPAILEQLEDGNRAIELGNLTPKRDFVHVRDVSRALLTILQEFQKSYRVFNIGTGTAWSVREVVECVEAAFNEEIEIIQDQERARESDRPHLEADISRMKEELGWEPNTEFVTGLRKLVRHQGIT